MYTQDDIKQFSLALVLGLYTKTVLSIGESCDLCIEDRLGVFEDNQLLIDFCNKNQYEIYMPFNGDKSRSGYFFDSMYQDKHFYKNVNTVYDINVLFDIGIPMIQLTEDDTELSQEVFDDVFSYSDTKELTPQQLEYIESLEWDCEYWDSLDVKVIDSLDPEVRELCFEYYNSMLLEQALDPVEVNPESVGTNDDNLQLFANHYSLIVWSSITTHHNFDILDSEDEYANKYEELILHEYYQDDKPYRAKDFHEFCISCPEANNIINKYIGVNILWQMGHTDEYVIEIASYFFENYDIPSEKEAYHKYAPHLIPVRNDVKLLPPVEVIPEPVIVIPQEVVSEPQEELSTTTNEDTVMNTNTLIPNWEVSGYVSILDLDFGTYVPVVEVEPIVEVVKPHYSDKWFGQCCDLNDNPEFTQWDIVRTSKPYFPEVVEFTPLPFKAPSIMNIGRGKVYFPIVLTPEQLDNAKAKIEATVIKAERKASLASPVKQRQVSPHATVPFGNAPEANRITNPKVTSAIGEACAVDPVSEFKSTLFNLDNFDVVKQATDALLDMFSPDEYNKLRDKYGVDVMKKAFNTLQGDVRTRIRAMINEANNIRNGIELTVVATQAPKATVAPKVSTATFASNFNSLVIAKYRELNNGIIKDSLVLNKLTSALRNNNLEAYNSLVTTFGNPTAVALHRQAYDAVVSAS